jgi:hypothetical protein
MFSELVGLHQTLNYNLARSHCPLDLVGLPSPQPGGGLSTTEIRKVFFYFKETNIK